MITKRKVFFAWQMAQEKKWLEDLAKQGLVLQHLGLFKYHFNQTEPQDLVYQFDFQILSKKTEPDYLDLFQDWTLAGKYGSWYYFYKPNNPEEVNDIYMDNSSKQSMFRRLLGFLLIVGFPLYYQILFVFPGMNPAKFEFPKFYFFMRILVVLFLLLWLYAIIRLFIISRQLKNNLKE